VDQIIQAIQQNGAGGGAGGTPGKPNTASVKFEPAHMHQIQHDIANMKAVIHQLADMFGLKVPASHLLHQPAPGTSAAAPVGGAAPVPDAGGMAGAPDATGGGSPIAVQLPQLPPVASKAAGAPGNRLAAGQSVPARPGDLGSQSALLAALGKRKAS
jgi:hypothetical protein